MSRAAATGVAGISIEDRTGDGLYPVREAAARVAAARAAMDAIDPNLVLVGRCEGILIGITDLSETIDRLAAYAAAGADCLYAPGLARPDDISAVVEAVAPRAVDEVPGETRKESACKPGSVESSHSSAMRVAAHL